MDVEGFETGESVAEGGDDGSEGDVTLCGVGAGVEVDVGDDVETTGSGVGGKEEFHGREVCEDKYNPALRPEALVGRLRIKTDVCAG